MKSALKALCVSIMLVSTGCQMAKNKSANEKNPVSEEWAHYMRPYNTMGEELSVYLNDPDDAQERHELYEFIFQNISLGYAHIFFLDPEYPDFWPLFNHAHTQGWQNPDTIHLFTPVDPNGTYRISGFSGDLLITDFEQAGGEFFTRGEVDDMAYGMGPTYSSDRIEDFTLSDNGQFSIIYSKDKPDGYSGDWRALHPKTTFMQIRQVMYDWENERDGRYAIERLDKPTGKPRQTAEQSQANLEQLSEFAYNWADVLFKLASRVHDRDLENKADFVDWAGDIGLDGQRYTVSPFNLAEDEAVIIETELPDKCLYWSYQVVSESWRAINPVQHQASINGFQAKLDDDGKFRVVISSKDPGVPNWMDNGGHNRARVYGRWNKCNGDPVQTVKTVKLSDVRQHLPENTAVISKEERDKSFRARRRALQLRTRW